MMELDKIVHWVVVNKLIRMGYNPTHVRVEYIAQLVEGLKTQFSEDQLMEEYRKWLH